MAIYIPRKAPLSWNFKWLPVSTYSASSDALQPEYGKHAYSNMAGIKDASQSFECTHTETLGLTSMMKCAQTKTVGLSSAVNSTHASMEGLTSSVVCQCKKMVGLRKDSFSLLATSHAMARMPLCVFQGLFYNMMKHIRTHSTKAEANTQCSSCGKFKSEKGFLICPSCDAVQAFNPAITFFQIFDQHEKFELDLKDLEARYKSLMKKLHPDLSHGKSLEEKENYAQLSALVTTAYNELLKPVSRATYMLKLRGIRVENEGTVTDSELIMEVMEIREALQSSPDRETLEQLHKRAMTRMEEWTEAFKSALKEGNDTNAIGALQRMSYFGRVCEDIKRELL